jgi:hypothetical protein
MVAILIGVRWNTSMVLICISFMARDSDHFFIWTSAFEADLLVQLPTSLLVHWFWESLIS